MKYTPIVGSLGFILSPDRQKVLMVHRCARQDDEHLGKYNGLGGKMESNEDICTCMTREIMEEAGIKVNEMSLRGTINWSGFGKNGEDWFGFIFLITAYEGEPYTSNKEGDLEWVSIKDLHLLPMWEGDRYFLPLVFDEDQRPFHGNMPWKDGKPIGWSFIRL